MQHAEHEVDRFWNAIDGIFREVMQHLDPSAAKRANYINQGRPMNQLFFGAIEDRQMHRTPRWSEEEEAVQQSNRPARIEEDRAAMKLWELEHRTEKTIGPDNTTHQSRRRKRAATQTDSPQVPKPGIPHEPDPAPVIPKNRRQQARPGSLLYTSLQDSG